jgi:Flp pilus assembly protein TadG
MHKPHRLPIKLTSSSRLSVRRKSTRGQATVETALVLPALVVLLMGIILVGFQFYAFIQVTNAAREGARAGSLYRMTCVVDANTTVPLPTTVQRAIYDSTTTPPTTALGYLPVTASSFSVTRDVACTLNGADCSTACCNCSAGPWANIGDHLAVTITYSYTTPVLSAFLPMFRQPTRIVRGVTMEVQ